MSFDPPANSTIWDELSQDDKSEYLRIREEFRKNQKVSSKDRRVVTFRKELLTVLQFLERGTDNLETRCILTGICFAGPIVCVNTRQLKSFLCRCKSSINGSFQQLGYLALKTKSKTRNCVLAVLPSLLDHQNILRQWTVRVVSDEALFCFVSSFSKIKIPIKIEEEDLFFEKNAADSVPMPQLSRQFPMQMPFYQQQQQQQQFNMMGMQYSYNPTMVNSLSQPNLQAYRFYPQPPIQPQQPQLNPCINYYNPQQVVHTSNFMGHQNQIYSQQHQHRQRPQLQLFQEFQKQNLILDQDQEQDPINSQTQGQNQIQSEQNKVHFVSHVKQNQHAVSFGAFVPPSSMPTRPTTLYPYPLSKEDESNQNCQQLQVSVTPTVIDSDLESADSEFDTPPESDTIQNDIADGFDNLGPFSSIQLNRSNDISRGEPGHPLITTSFSMNRIRENHYHDVDFDFPQIEEKDTNDNENTNNIEFDMNGNENENHNILEDIEPNPQFLSFIYPDQQKTLSRSQSAKIHFDNWDNFNDFF